ncbi:Transcription factor MUTE [Hibiscus syriacus]|uniref:Transcription factor MUTE n=1 Tax=Hibiscus syriacus TaxID=106335 RepID=A0A6A3ANN9_HIBSY|nr:Transcription factor MUTE [Hibiscus syriacus]
MLQLAACGCRSKDIGIQCHPENRLPTDTQSILKIIAVLERFSFEVLHLNISSMEDTVLYSFVIKIGLECQLSLEELAVEVQQSFFSEPVFLNEI